MCSNGEEDDGEDAEDENDDLDKDEEDIYEDDILWSQSTHESQPFLTSALLLLTFGQNTGFCSFIFDYVFNPFDSKYLTTMDTLLQITYSS